MNAICAESAAQLATTHAELALAPTALAGVPEGPSPARRPTHLPRPRRDGSRTSLEARVAFSGEKGGLTGPFSKLTLADITSGLPEDSREADERELAKRRAEQKGRVAAAKKALEGHPEAQQQVLRDQTRLRMFCARFGVTPQEICPHAEDLSARVVAPGSPRDGMCTWCSGWHGWKPREEVADVAEVIGAPYDWLSEVRARELAALPYDPEGDGAGWGVKGGFARA